MNTLNEIDTKNIKPTSHVIELNNVFREDVVKPSELADDILANAPEREGLYFKVKKVIE
jgi:aspartyl-tRNA(Asn)/glutamyl-tRNA(Gln) amidotransferase subunit C